MKPARLSILILLLLACAIFSHAASNSADNNKHPHQIAALDTDLTITKVESGVYVITHNFPWPSNSIVLVMKNGDILIGDTPYTPEATKKLIQWVTDTFHPHRITAVNTHYHIDRLGGNAALLKHNLPVYGSDHTVRLLNERGESTKQQMMAWISDPKIKDAYRSLEFEKPNRVFPEKTGLTLQFGKETVRLFYPGPGHTPDNMVLYYPAKRVLFAGCAIIAGSKLGNTTEANINDWLKSLDSLSKLSPRIVIPGHGGETTGYSPDLIDNTKKLLTEAGNRH